MALAITTATNAQTLEEAQKPPKESEKVVGTISFTQSAGEIYYYKPSSLEYKEGKREVWRSKYYNDKPNYSDETLLNILKNVHRDDYKKYSKFELRNFKSKYRKVQTYTCEFFDTYTCDYYLTATVVVPSNILMEVHLKEAIEKAIISVDSNTRFAIGTISVTSDIEEESVKDNVIDILLDKGFKVVAKEYLQRLHEEQQQQQSGVYNDNTLAQTNNFSAVGYFINVKITDNAFRVQVINVSTGEYVGNATITF